VTSQDLSVAIDRLKVMVKSMAVENC